MEANVASDRSPKRETKLKIRSSTKQLVSVDKSLNPTWKWPFRNKTKFFVRL